MNGKKVLVAVVLIAGLLIFFFGGSSGLASALGSGMSGMRSSGRGGYNSYRGFDGSSFDSGWKDVLNTHDILQEKIDSYNRKVQHYDFSNFKTWGGLSDECTSKETWTQRCGYHR